jgi:hypothetical protein
LTENDRKQPKLCTRSERRCESMRLAATNRTRQRYRLSVESGTATQGRRDSQDALASASAPKWRAGFRTALRSTVWLGAATAVQSPPGLVPPAPHWHVLQHHTLREMRDSAVADIYDLSRISREMRRYERCS